jgi:hypothetical protein
MPPVPDRSTFESAYAGQAPWDIGRPLSFQQGEMPTLFLIDLTVWHASR